MCFCLFLPDVDFIQFPFLVPRLSVSCIHLFCFVGVYLTLQLCVWFPVLPISFLNMDTLLSLHENLLFKFKLLLSFCSAWCIAHFSQKLPRFSVRLTLCRSLHCAFCVCAWFPISQHWPDRIIFPVYFALLFCLFNLSHLIARMPFWVAILFSQKATCNFVTQVHCPVYCYH